MTRIVIFDLSRHIHLPSYLQFLVEFWGRPAPASELTIVTWQTLTEKERRKKLALESTREGLSMRFHDLLRRGRNPDFTAQYDWELFCRYTSRLNASHGFIVHIDHYLPLLAAGATAPTPVSGIYFGPSFHYGDFDLESVPEASKALREKFVLARALRHPSLDTLFFLDPFAAKRAQAFPCGEKAVYLADPVRRPERSSPEDAAPLRAELGIEPDRKVFLLFGHLTRRKGVHQILEAVRQLPSDVCRRFCLVLAGAIDPHDQAHLDAGITVAHAALPVQIVTRYGFVPATAVPAYFELADAVLTPYLDHAGMSGILLLAAAHRKPVLSSAHGLMGEMVRQHRLGLTVDAKSLSQLAAGLKRLATGDPETMCDPACMARLAEEHHPERFATAIFERLSRSRTHNNARPGRSRGRSSCQ